MNVFYYLNSCDTCKKIQKTLNLPDSIKLVNVKEYPLTRAQLSDLFEHTKSYKSLLNTRAQLLRKRGLKASALSEEESKALLLEHYSFLKRPILMYQNQAFIGNAAATVEAAKNALHA